MELPISLRDCSFATEVQSNSGV